MSYIYNFYLHSIVLNELKDKPRKHEIPRVILMQFLISIRKYCPCVVDCLKLPVTSMYKLNWQTRKCK